MVDTLYGKYLRGARRRGIRHAGEMYDLDQPPQADGSTLYVSQLRPQGGAATQGSGTSTLRLSADETSAVVNFSYSNLTGPITSMHIHAADGTILFDLDDATPQPDGSLIWVFEQVGSFSVADIINLIKTGQTYLNLHTALYPTGEIKGFYNISTGAQVVPEPTPPPPLASGPPTVTDAGRFLSQSTFGATSALISKVQNEGFDAFLNEQFAAPISRMAFVRCHVH